MSTNRYHVATYTSWGVVAWSLAVLYGYQRGHHERWWCSFCPEDLPRDLSAKPRYSFFLSWSHRVPTEYLALSECVNFHCTALPEGRGGAPIENLLRLGRTETVITAHRMTAEFDAGPIYGTRGPISLAGSKAEIQQRFIEPCADLIRWIIETEPTPTPQVGEPTYFKRLPKADYEKFWANR